MTRCVYVAIATLATVSASTGLQANEREWEAALAKIRAVGLKGEGHREAVLAAQRLAQQEVAALVPILRAMDGANPIAENWLRGTAEAVAQRHRASGGQLPQSALEAFLADSKQSPRGRRLAYELVAGVDPTAEKRLIPQLLDDPSLELRRDAVAQALAVAGQAAAPREAIAAYQKALYHARDLDQIKEAAAQLKERGEQPDIAGHMGFVMTWRIVGPFDNVDDKGWNAAYPPEANVDLGAEYDGQKGRIRWIEHTTTDDYGLVDLTKALDKHKGAVAYAYAEFLAQREQPCELRLSCINANKVWLNGQLLAENHVYHANDPIDQYISRGTLRAGKNAILLKICQNEQTENWAQRWEFKLRVCDEIGTAILSQDRPVKKLAAWAPVEGLREGGE